MLNLQKKAFYIADELELDADDVLDVLLGTITKPKSLVDEVLRMSDNYDLEKAKNS